MKFNFRKNNIIINEKEIHLTKTEIQILNIIYKSNNKAIKSNDLIREIYKIEPDNGLKETLRKLISLLNKKIGPDVRIRSVAKIGYYLDENTDKKVKDDLKFIKKDIIVKKRNGNYCRYSKTANMVTHSGISEKSYKEYWMRRYRYFQERLPEILEACTEKLNNELTNTEDFIELVRKSDNSEEEKRKIIKSLGGNY